MTLRGAPVGFVSTRSPTAQPVSFEQAMLRGLAPDGGLYLPTALPEVRGEEWLSANSPAEVAAAVLPSLVGLGRDEVHEVFADAIDFPVPVVELPRSRFVLELFHGPTAAFKDVGARSMARLMDRVLARSGRRVTILVATSGDTGGAVADAFAGSVHASVAVLYPAGRISDVQERQLVAKRPGVTTFAVDGSFDDCQRLVKEAFADPDLARSGLSTANSINVARLLPQIVYYLWAERRLVDLTGERRPFTVVVPSGNLGNLTAGVMATRLGLSAATLVAAHNANDYLVRYLDGRSGAFEFSASVETLSNAMDVGAPSNFERLNALAGSGSGPVVRALAVDDDATTARMAASVREDGYLPCPHTAVGLEVVERWRARVGGDREEPVLALATAHPAKFPDVVRLAIGSEPPEHVGLAALDRAERAVVPLKSSLAALRSALLDLASA